MPQLPKAVTLIFSPLSLGAYSKREHTDLTQGMWGIQANSLPSLGTSLVIIPPKKDVNMGELYTNYSSQDLNQGPQIHS